MYCSSLKNMNRFQRLQLHNFCHQIPGSGSALKPMWIYERHCVALYSIICSIFVDLSTCVQHRIHCFRRIFEGISQNLFNISQLHLIAQQITETLLTPRSDTPWCQIFHLTRITNSCRLLKSQETINMEGGNTSCLAAQGSPQGAG